MTTKIRATLVKPLDQQQDRDGYRIDPAGVAFDPDARYPIHDNFDYSKPPLGWAKIVREDDGSLVIDGELYEPISTEREEPPLTAAIGVTADETIRYKQDAVIDHSRAISVGLTAKHADPTQPPVTFEEGAP